MAPGGAVVAAAENEQVQVHHGDQCRAWTNGSEAGARGAIDMIGLVGSIVRHAIGCRKRANLA
ncbi:hypothetical protein D3C81_2037870 [compost metagenome]